VGFIEEGVGMTVTIMIGDVREQLRKMADNSLHCVVTSPPYWGLRDYGVEGQIGREASPAEFIATMVEVFEEVRRVLMLDGTCWINMGDSYAGSGKGRNADGSHSGGGKQDTHLGSIEGVLHKVKKVEGLKPKDLVMMPHRLAVALQDAGWWVRQDIVWSKPNPMPESVRDRCTKAHEYIFLLTKSERYYFDQEAILEPVSPNTHARLSQDVQNQVGSDRVPGKTNGNMKAVARSGSRMPAGWATGTDRKHEELDGRYSEKRKLADAWPGIKNDESIDTAMSTMLDKRNKRSVWTITTQGFKEAHFATFPPELPEICIKAGCPIGGTVLDPFFGAGTTGLVADRLQRHCIGIELNPVYAEIARKRIEADSTLFSDVQVAA
jgi:DNA modification methylase